MRDTNRGAARDLWTNFSHITPLACAHYSTISFVEISADHGRGRATLLIFKIYTNWCHESLLTFSSSDALEAEISQH